jgi:hypothetical protein
MRVQSCYFCRGSAENATKDNKLSCCRKCCIEKLLPLIASAIGPVVLAQAANRLASTPGAAAGPKPMVPETDKIAKLLYGSRGAEMSRGTGRPAQPARRMTKAQQALAVARAQARQNGEVIDQDIKAMVCRAGLAVNAPTELSTATAGTVGATNSRTTAGTVGATNSKVPTKADIREMCRRAGLAAG